MKDYSIPHWLQPWLLVLWVELLGFFFAHVEIQIEGPAGWGAALPTWHIENSWWLDVFWEGRPMTGYHAWVFPFMTLIFHFPVFVTGRWSWHREARIIGCIMLFWVSEDFLWFVFNPAYGLSKFAPQYIPWHKHWWGVAPIDYWVSSIGAAVLLYWSYGGWKQKKELPGDDY